MRFIRGPQGSGITTAYDQETGMSFTIERVEYVGGRGGRAFKYEIHARQYRNGVASHRVEEDIMRMDSAKRRCFEILRQRKTGEDR